MRLALSIALAVTLTILFVGACEPDCTTTLDCGPPGELPGTGAMGVGGSAVLALGEPCGASDACESGECIDGLCCDATCSGICESCAIPGS